MASTVKITCYGKTYEMPLGISLQEVLTRIPEQSQPFAAIVNGRQHDLAYNIYTNSTVEWLDLSTSNGYRIYKRSLVFMLLIAANRLYPQYQLKVSHSLSNGLYCEMRGDAPFTKQDIVDLEKEMQKITADALPIVGHKVTKTDAFKFFMENGKEEKAHLIEARCGDEVEIFDCDGMTEYLFGPMAQSTSQLQYFSLSPFDVGFVLCLPNINGEPFVPGNFKEQKHLQAVLKEYQLWGETLGIVTIADLNKVIADGKISQLIQIDETKKERTLHEISDKIFVDFPTVKIVLVAGPSSSGKTTFAQRLAIQFRTLGINPVTISMDNYFLNREQTPIDEFGEKDYESIHALDLPLFNEHLLKLINGEEIEIPRYDFINGARTEETKKIRLGAKEIVIIEGIHGINPELTASIPDQAKRKIYISSLTQLNMDDTWPLSSSDCRSLRRMARDMKFRGASPEETIIRWASVRRGENKNIFPYQENADFYFNSALIYEMPVLRPILNKALAEIPTSSPAYIEARRLQLLVEYFTPVVTDTIPLNSILQEFLGNSCFDV